MKKVDKSLSKDYLPVKLYLDDLESIEEILKEHDSYFLRTDDYQYDSINELKLNLKTDRIRKLDIDCRGVSINLGKMSARVYVSSNAAKNTGAFYQIDQVLSKRTRTAKWAYTFPFILALGPVVLSLTTFMSFSRSSSRTYLLISLLFVLLTLAWVIWVYYVRLASHSLKLQDTYWRSR